MMKLNSKEKIGLAVVAGAVALMVVIPICCSYGRCPEKRFIQGGKEMLGAIPDMAKKCTSRIAKKVIM